MKLIFSTPALRELNEAINYYELEVEGLGSRFKAEVDLARKRISAHTHLHGLSKRKTYANVFFISFHTRSSISFTAKKLLSLPLLISIGNLIIGFGEGIFLNEDRDMER